MNERGRERTAAGLGTVGRGGGVGAGGGREVWGGGREGGSCLIRVLAAKHLPCSSPTPIHITPVLLHP